MIAISVAVLYVATKCLDQFIKEEGYGRLKQLVFPKDKYIDSLRDLIMEVLDDFARIDQNKYSGKIPFYHSPEVFQALMDHVIFKDITLQRVIDKLAQNPNVQSPQSNEVKLFFECFYQKVKSNSKLKKIFIEENYQAEIFEISSSVNLLSTQLSEVQRDISSIDLKISDLSSSHTASEHPVITIDYVVAPEENALNKILKNKHVLLLSGVSFCGKSQLAKKIAEQFVQEGYRYAGGTEVSEADRFLRNQSGKHIYLLEDPFGHNIESENQRNLRKVEELIRNLVPGNKLIVTSRSEVLLSANQTTNIQNCSLDSHSWTELTIRDRDFLINTWTIMAVHLPQDCKTQIETHLQEDTESHLLQVGQLAHLSRLPPEMLSGKSLQELMHMAKADARQLSLEIKNRGLSSSRLYTVLGLVASTTQGIKMDDLAYVLSDSDAYPGFLENHTIRSYSSKCASEVSFPVYDEHYALNTGDQMELMFFEKRGYLEISHGQIYFKHPTYQDASKYLLLETTVFEVEIVLEKIKRTLSCLSTRNSAYLARHLSFIYKGVHQTDLKTGILEMIYELANHSIFPSVRDWLLKFLLEFLSDMDEQMQDGTFRLIDTDMSSSDIFWEADQPFYSNFDRDFFDEDEIDEKTVMDAISEFSPANEISALKLWSIVNLLSTPDFDLSNFPDKQIIDHILNAEETFIRSKMAYIILKRIPSVDQKILDRIFNDTNPWVVVEAIRGAIIGYPNYSEQERQDILPKLQKAVANGFVIARIKTLLSCFGIDYGPDHIDWDLIKDSDRMPMWNLWGMLFPAFLENMPISVRIYNSGRFGQTMDASIEYLKNTTSGLKVAESFFRWVDARISNGLMPDTYELGVISYLLEISSDPEVRLPLFQKIFQYPKSSLLLYSMSWAINSWPELGEQEKQIILDLYSSDRKDKRWVIATAITRTEPPTEILQLLYGRVDLFTLSPEEIIKVIGPETLKDSLEVYTGQSNLISGLGISYSRNQKWHEIVKYILVNGHNPGFELCLKEFILHVINGPALEWKDDYQDIWKEMCSKDNLKSRLSDQLILETANSNPSIPSCTALWKILIASHLRDQQSKLATKVALAIEAIQKYEPMDLFKFFDKDFFDLIFIHCPLDRIILSVLLEFKDKPSIPPEVMDKLANEVAELSKTESVRLELTFDYIKKFKHRESGHPRFKELEKIPNLIDEKAKEWLEPRREKFEIQDWVT